MDLRGSAPAREWMCIKCFVQLQVSKCQAIDRIARDPPYVSEAAYFLNNCLFKLSRTKELKNKAKTFNNL